MGDEVPTAERKEARAAEEPGEVAAGRPGKPEEKGAQEALEGLGGSQNQEDRGLGGPREAGRPQEGSSATEQTWGWEEGSSHGSQAHRQDTGVWEAAKAARCQEPRAHLEARKESKAGCEAARDSSSQAQESQRPNEQEVDREETLRTWEQEEEAEEVRERNPEVAKKAESEWTWHREPEGEAGADGQKVAGDSRESLEQPVKEAVAQEIQGSAANEAGKEEEVMGVLRGSPSTKAQKAQESGSESEDGTTSVREEARTALGREEDSTALGRKEDSTALGRVEDGTASDREEARTVSGKEGAGTSSGWEEDRIVSGRGEAGTASGGEEDRTVSGRGEDGTASDTGEDSIASEREEEDRTASDREEARTATGREEAGITLGRVEARTTSGGEEDRTVSGRREDGTASDRGEDSTASEREEEDRTATGREEAGATSGKEEDSRASGREEEDSTASGGEEDSTASGREEAGITFGRVEATTTSAGKGGDLSGARKTEYEEVSGEKIPEGTGRAWAFQEASRGDQEKEVDENREAEMSFSPKQTQALGTEGTEEAAKDQTAGREAAEGQGSEGEVGAGFEVQADQGGKEAEERQASMVRAVPASLEEVMQAEKAKEEEEGCWATEAELPKDNVANEAEGDTDLEATPEASSPEKEFSGERSEGEAQTGGEAQGVEWGGLEHEVTEGQEPELKAGPQTPTEQPEEGQGGEEELCGASSLSKEETEGGLEEYPRTMGDVKPDALGAEVWENQGRDVERGETQEEKADAEEGEEEAAGGQAPKEAEGGRESALPDVPEAGGEWKTAQDSGCGTEEGGTLGAESQELGGRLGADTGTGQSPGESDVRETKDELVETTHGENRGGPEFGLEGSADKEVTGRGDQAEALEAREGEPRGERVEVPEGVVAEGSCGVDGFTSGSQPARAEGTVATVEAEGLPGGQTLLEEEAVGWQMKERGQGSEGQGGDHHPEGEAGRPLGVEDAEVTEDRRAEAEEIVPEGLEDVQGQENQSTHQEPAEAEPGPRGEIAESARGDACDSWSEALLPVSLLDVSVPRSRVLLSRNSSLRRSRPSFRRSRAPEQQEGPPSPPPEEERSAPEQRLLQPEETPEPSPPEPEGTPLPARRRPLGRGFGLAHGGMMQELQARLGQPKPQ
uniref:Apolipoprotein B receptor n=1 Tax=Ailuropoda melanoleuca TaxID=9646 RepID=A0A7N5JXY5_AILME